MNPEQELERWKKLLDTKEPLHADLKHTVRIVAKMEFISNPFFCGINAHNAMTNEAFRHQKALADKYLKEKKWLKYILAHEKPYLIQAIIDHGNRLSDKEYWELVAYAWTAVENLWQYKKELEVLLTADRKQRQKMMDIKEQNALIRLPYILTVYRGFQERLNKLGWSWTLDRAKAEWFAKRYHADKRKPRLAIGECDRQQVVALFLGRNESEIVINPKLVKNLKTVPVK